jgi:hypothetical protein
MGRRVIDIHPDGVNTESSGDGIDIAEAHLQL